MPFPHLPYLDELRPEPGWRTERAVVSTYSAQLPVVAATLLALAGEVDEKGSGSRMGLVRALRGLRGKVHFLMQSGRLTQGRHDTAISALFDQFFLQVPWNEGEAGNGKSWHAKFALAKQVREDGSNGERWIFLLGSRNLTMDTSWDIGLSLAGGDTLRERKLHEQQSINGVGELAKNLAITFPANLSSWGDLGETLEKVSWWIPKGWIVSDLRLMLPDQEGRVLPKPPDDLKRVIVVSPFLDKSAVDEILKWPADGHELLSTHSELDRVLGGVTLATTTKLLALAEATFDEPATQAEDGGAYETDQVGLHAKMIYAEHGKASSSLWLGSPNLTRRAWTRNAEVLARVDSTSRQGLQALQNGVQDLLDRATLVEKPKSAAGEKTSEERLALARNQVAAKFLVAKQQRGADGQISISCEPAPHPDDAEITLQCGQVRGSLVEWSRNSKQFTFPNVAAAVDSSFLHCRLSLKDASVAWIQLIPFDPLLDIEERDARVLSEYLGSAQMLNWIHSVLSGYPDGDEGGAWDAERTTGRHARNAKTQLELPTLEQALRMWLKDSARLDEVDRIVALRRKANIDESDSSKADLEQFISTWTVIRQILKGKRR